LDSRIQGLLYVALKFGAYAAWCALGLLVVRRAVTVWGSLKFGLLRLGIGIGFGLTIFIVGGMMHLDPPAHPLAVYIGVYAPVRLVEWLILYAILRSPALQDTPRSAGAAMPWVFGGILVSFLADIPMLLMYEGAEQFLPVGRFLC
jgi:hypothetical protein